MKWLDHEELRVLLQDARHQVVANLLLYQGTLDSSAVRAAEVFRPAVTRKSMGIVVSHNHSTGDSTPSTEDITVIENLVQATNHERKPGCVLQTSFHGIFEKDYFGAILIPPSNLF